MLTRTFQVAMFAIAGFLPVTAMGASSAFLAPSAWTCNQIGAVKEAYAANALGVPPQSSTARDVAADLKAAGCLPNFSASLTGRPSPIGLLDVAGPYAFVCVRLPGAQLATSVGSGVKSYPYCSFTLVSSVVDKSGKALSSSELRAVVKASSLQTAPLVSVPK